MFYITLDSKEECLGYYYNGAIHDTSPDPDKNHITWDYSHPHHQDGIEYLKLYCGGKSLGEVCPDHLGREWNGSLEKTRAFEAAIKNSKIDADDVCIYDLVPPWFMKEISQLKCEILEHVHQNFYKPATYDFMLGLEKLFADIRENTLRIDTSSFRSKLGNSTIRNFLHRVRGKTSIEYSQFGTITGRLTVTSDSFPILNIERSLRGILKPNNDLFVEFDYNAAELRTLLSLSDQEQPKRDIHEWNIENVFKKKMTRAEAKKKIFSAIYNPNIDQDYYKVEKVLKKYYNSGKIKTPFGREIECDDGHALNYILQSTTSDLVLDQVMKINKILEGKKSRIVFLIHDSFVLDLAQEERSLISEIKEIFSRNRIGDFLVNVSAGRDFGSMRRINI